ncbi:hypothetical protein I316_00502 [Kwoniella heveanensis BCC8398]|uniref:DDT domain-containing protein n=1 Tax=Kwoniella heveanensis BCC8398 TaxID=1296120 RepID=A0A1B9H287_9TREE|nr:hypothetical protein I316_00502 [Kwoniella heveanensis BCC8398]
MPLLKRKPVLPTPLPAISSILQAVPSSQAQAGESSTTKPSAKQESSLPAEGKDDDEQLDKLLSIFRGEIAGISSSSSTTGGSKGKKASLKNGAKTNGHLESEGANGHAGGENGQPSAAAAVNWKLQDKECWYLPETGEIFTDYESFCARRQFYLQPLFQCEVSGKSSLTYFAAVQSEQKEVRQLHSRFPRQLKKAVLSAVQFQIEGKLDTLADKIYERFHNRFFDDEKVFVDVDGDKYLARIVKTFPPRSLLPSSSPYKPAPTATNTLHPYAKDLSLPIEEVNEKDDPMRYFYNVRLIEEGATEGIAADYASNTGLSNGHDDEEDEKGEKWQASTMEVQADKISRDRINFSRAMLKRFMRDCVVRDSAVYSPWLVKPSVAARYGLPTEMPAAVKENIARYKEQQMDKRKREREERLGITHEPEPPESEKPKTKKQKKDEEKKIKEEEKLREKEAKDREREREEEEKKKKKTLKYPAEDLLVEWSEEKDGAAGRIEIRPTPNKTLPFADEFEKFLMAWSFLNVMGKPLGLSPFTLDDFEQSLYHNDPYTNPAPLMIEIHAALLNCLVADLTAGHEPVQPLSACGKEHDNDTDYWEGKKGATTETLSPVAAPLSESWKTKELVKEKKGWEASLVGCLWDRATLETLPNYLDNILHLMFEDKPAPTRPTWSTGPSTTSSVSGLIPSKPEKRYSSLHHLHKLDIIAFLIELVAQTEALREFMEESTAALTEVRKDQVEAKREWRRIQAEREALEPKERPKENADGTEGVDADGDVSMDIKTEHGGSPNVSINGHLNGHGHGTDRDELEDSPSIADLSDNESEHNVGHTAASRRKAMREKALEREAEENLRNQKLAKEREDARLKKIEGKQIAAEKKRLADEEEIVNAKIRHLEHDFRRWMYTLRSRPLGLDRFGNKVWWMDGLGSAPVLDPNGKLTFGTGRLYLQGVDEEDIEILRGAASAAIEEEVDVNVVSERRAKEEGDGRLAPGQWAIYDNPEQLAGLANWLNPKGLRESQLLKNLKMWYPEIEGGMKKRRTLAGLDTPAVPEGSHDGSFEGGRRMRPTRKAVTGEEEKQGYMSWRNRRTVGKD